MARLLQLLMSAREPPSMAVLEAFGLRAALQHLPGWGVLFQARPNPSPCGSVLVHTGR